MQKILSPGAYDFYGEPIAQMIKVSSKGLIGKDLSDLVKRAGHRIADQFKNIKFANDEVPIHMLAVGATELYGPNRNGDGFSEDICRRYHDTFCKYARWYRNHQNTDPSKSYGIVKHSDFHEPMKRIELIIGLNSTKEAADRNGGLVATEELEKLAKGQDMGVSMACKVSHDICSVCGNKAKTRADYCRGIKEGGSCKGGGLMDGMGEVIDIPGFRGHTKHAINPDPRFFDISKVYRPADRIAFVMGELQKAASDNRVLSGAELAEMLGITAPLELSLSHLSPTVATQVKIAHQLAQKEASVQQIPQRNFARAFCSSVQPEIADVPDLNRHNLTKLAQVTKALAGQKVALPLRDFLSLVTGDDREKVAAVVANVGGQLPGIYSRMIADNSVESLARNNPYVPDVALAPPNLRVWAEKQASAYSLDVPRVVRRTQQHSLHGQPAPELGTATKTASAAEPAYKLAQQYAMYKLAFLQEVQPSDSDFPLTCALTVLQNYIID